MAKNTNLIDDNALLYYHKQIKSLLEGKVDKEVGKSLISDSEITRLSSVVNYDDTDVKSAISAMESTIEAIQSNAYDDTQLRADIAATYATILNLTTHTGDSTIHITDTERSSWNAKPTTSQVNNAITSAISGITGIEFVILTGSQYDSNGVPTITGENGKIYLTPCGAAAPDAYNEYIWVSNAFEKLGTTDAIDLSNYYNTDDLATNADIDAIINS